MTQLRIVKNSILDDRNAMPAHNIGSSQITGLIEKV
jgi:hypothetical protein